MTASFMHVFRGEWLKRKRSFTSSLVIVVSLFTPALVAAIRLLRYRGLPAIYSGDAFWQNMWHSCWESMAIFFLPLGAILATSLVTHIEFRSNAWKQVHTLPARTSIIFLAKLTVILITMAQLLLLFTLGVYVSGMIPYLLIAGVPHPKGSFLSMPLLRENALYFVDCLPIVAAQYLMALRSSNVLVPIGIGFMAWVAAVAAVSSRLAVWWPYSYPIVHYIVGTPKGAHFGTSGTFHWMAAIWFVLLTIISYVLFTTKAERG